jgi:hypothetical protein
MLYLFSAMFWTTTTDSKIIKKRREEDVTRKHGGSTSKFPMSRWAPLGNRKLDNLCHYFILFSQIHFFCVYSLGYSLSLCSVANYFATIRQIFTHKSKWQSNYVICKLTYWLNIPFRLSHIITNYISAL